MSRLLTLLGLLAAVGTAVFSEEVEIIVTASRIEEDARSAPAYVRVIPEKDIRAGRSVLDALSALPDIAIRGASPGQSYVSMGGFGENGFARTLILVDGRPVNRADMASVNWRTIPLDRVERIEVVKGPMSSRYGDQAIAGVINIITREPEGFEAWARTDLSSNLSNRQAAGVAWAGESVRGDLAVSRDDLRPVRDRSDNRVLAADASVGMTLGPVDLDLKGFVSDADYQLPGGLLEVDYIADPDQAGNPEDEVAQLSYGASLATDVEIGEFKLSLPVSWRRVDSLSAWPTGSFPMWGDNRMDDLRAGLQGSGVFLAGTAGILTPVLGVDINWANLDSDYYSDADRTILSSSSSADRAEYALFGRIGWAAGEHWNFDGGIRFAWYRINANSALTDYFPTVFDAGGSWLPNKRWTVNLRYGRVFRYPLLDEQLSGAVDLEPEIGHHITASAEFNLPGFRAAVAPYFLSMNDEIMYNSATYLNENIGDTFHYGGVISADLTIGIVMLGTSYSVDRAQFQDSGKTVPLVPLHTVVGTLQVSPFDSFGIATDVRYTSSYYKGGDNGNTEGTVPGRSQLNLRMDWNPLPDLTVRTELLNLFGNRVPSVVYWSDFSGEEAWYPSNAREFHIGVDWRYE